RRCGRADADILANHPDLTPADLEAAWEYHRRNRPEIERALWLNRAPMHDYPGGVPVAVLVRGRQLGLTDSEIRETFDPPLEQVTLDAAWTEYSRRRDEIDRGMRASLPAELVED